MLRFAIAERDILLQLENVATPTTVRERFHPLGWCTTPVL